MYLYTLYTIYYILQSCVAANIRAVSAYINIPTPPPASLGSDSVCRLAVSGLTTFTTNQSQSARPW